MTTPPVGGLQNDTSSNFGLSFDYTLRISDDLYKADQQVSNPNEVKTIFHRYSIGAAYRISDQFVFSANVPFLDGTFEERGVAKETITGLGDLSLIGSWRPAAVQGLSLKLGVIAPTGEDRNQPLIGIAAPSVFQLGTGAWQVLLGAGYTKKSGDWTFSSQINVSLPLETSSQGFKPAESYFLSLGAGRAINDSLSFRLAVQGSYTTKDSYQGFILANTGATTISVRPSLIWQIRDNLSMSGSVNIPVYRDINETGIAAGPTFSVGFSKSF